MTRKGETPPNKGEGVTSKVRTERHQVHGWGQWWLSQEHLDKYAARQRAIKRMHVAGYTDLEKYLEMEKQRRTVIENFRIRERWSKLETGRLKKKYGLAPHANRTHLLKVWMRTDDPDIAKLLHLQDTLTATDTEKIDKIRKIFLDESLSPAEKMYRTALVVGLNLRKK